MLKEELLTQTQQSAIKRLKSLLICFLFLVLFIACNEKQSTIDQEIMGLMIDKYAVLPPPPPSINANDTIVDAFVADSLKSLKLKIGVWTKMQNTIGESALNSIPKEYLTLYKKSKKENIIEDATPLISRKGHTTFIVDTLQVKKSMDFKGFDLLFNISKIYNNTSRNLAIFELGISQSRLSGSSAVYCLKKDNGSWKVETVIETVIW